MRNPIIQRGNAAFSVFSVAPIPLIIKLGELIGDKLPCDVYQKTRFPDTWEWQAKELTNSFVVDVVKTVKTGDTAQIVSGNDIYVTKLINDNTTQKGVSLKAQIYVTGELQNRGRLRGIPPILTNQETIISEDCTRENLVISEDTEIAEDTSVTIKNDMVVNVPPVYVRA